MTQISYKRHQFPPSIIQHAIWLGFGKLTDCRLFSEFLDEAKLLKLHRAAIGDLPDFVLNLVNLTKPEIVSFTVDPDENLVQMPSPLW